MKFRNLACAHLSRYKVDSLGIREDGIFRYRKRNIPKSHILPIALRDRNILEQYRHEFFTSSHSKISFHRYFHHLNSSQALCINFFYPLIAENKLELFLKFLGVDPVSDFEALFEKESDIEKAKRRTSFDFFMRLDGIRKIYVEVKYTEQGFARAKHDEEHRKKFHETYLPLLKDKEDFLVPECRDESFFLDHYQVLRNLVHMNDKDAVVLFFASANSVVTKQAGYARDHLLTDKGKAQLRIVYLEEIVPLLETGCRGTVLDGYYQEFRAKYLPLPDQVRITPAVC